MYDAKSTYDIYQLQKETIIEEELQQVSELESQLIPVLHDMRINGVPVDIDRAEKENDRLLTENQVLLDQIYQVFPDLNVFSPTQLGVAVAERGIVPEKTEKGNDSVSNEFLLSLNDPLLNMIGQYRQQEKIRRDFIQGMILEDSYEGRVHPQWFQTRGSSFMSGDDTGGTRSGRIACSNPNLAQIPSRHPTLGPLVRSLFIPYSGDSWFKGDLSQQEPRISLHYAHLLKMTGAAEARQVYLDNPHTDYHTLTMEMVNKVSPTPITRTQAKTINLGVAYGMGKQKLADGLQMSTHKAQALLNSYHEGFPFMKELMNYCIEVAEQRGFVKTVLGRRRRFDMWEPPYFQRGKFPIKGKEAAMAKYGSVRRASLHKAMNSIVQGSAAEQMKRALVEIHAQRIPLLITLYDEIGASIQSGQQAVMIKEITEHAIEFTVPQVMEFKVMDSWGGK
jgi:DNA polymerase I-like protein with 3'-5' exonuclease and polymerase domains